MNFRLVEKALKPYFLRLESGLNKRLGREYIPAGRTALNIETSSACNLKCRFCAYEKKQSARVSMSNAMFASVVEQALALGFSEFHLTPTTGDVFMDRKVFDKLAFMDAHPQVRGYQFYTNFTIPTVRQVEHLTRLKKLTRMTVSVYGHDEASFIAIAKSSRKIFRRLIANLETLLALRSQWPFKLTIGFRSTLDVPKEPVGELMLLLKRLEDVGVYIHASHGIYGNWGGYITQEDVQGLNVKILEPDSVYRLGPCVKLFDGFQVMATGVVNACSCRDVDATLALGKVQETPLEQIISETNPVYRRLIAEQDAGEFRPVCRNCDFYRGIYHCPSSYRREKTPVQTREAFFAGIRRS